MADDAPDKESKTEDPSSKKLEDARKKGDVVKSQEVTTWFTLAGSAFLFAMLAPSASAGLMDSLKIFMANADQYEIGGSALGAVLWGLFSAIILTAIIPMLVLSACGVAANLIQHQPLISTEPITPKFSKVSPLAGFKRLFSQEALVNFAKGLVKISIIGAVMFFVLWPERDSLDTMITLEPALILVEFQQIGLKIFWAVLAVVTVIAIADYVYQRQRWWTRQKMTLQEVRDEYKQMEGDPKIKGRIRQMRLERSRKRMMASVPNATVIITNPTHFAVALQYDDKTPAPKCVAKGTDAVALRIRELAKEHDVPIVENPPLARALYASVEIDDVIPVEHFKAVAQVIGYVMRLRHGNSWKPSRG